MNNEPKSRPIQDEGEPSKMTYEQIKAEVEKHGTIWQDEEGYWYVDQPKLGDGETEEIAVGMAALALWPETGVPVSPPAAQPESQPAQTTEDYQYISDNWGHESRLAAQVLAEMVADEAFADLCQSIGEEPDWLKKARTLLEASHEPQPINIPHVSQTVSEGKDGLPLASVQPKAADMVATSISTPPSSQVAGGVGGEEPTE